MAWLTVLLGEASVAALGFGYVLWAHDYVAMPQTLAGFFGNVGPYLLLLSLISVAPVLALVRPIAKGDRA